MTISFLTASQADCMEQVEGECTKVKVTSTNVGPRSGDANCTVRFFNRDRHQTGVIDMLITSNVAPGDSSSWVAHILGGSPSSYRAKCSAYDPGALENVG